MLRCLTRPLPLMASRPYLVAAVALPIGAALISWRVRRLRSDAQFTARAPPKAQLAVLNPRGNHYNDAVLPMLNELFRASTQHWRSRKSTYPILGALPTFTSMAPSMAS